MNSLEYINKNNNLEKTPEIIKYIMDGKCKFSQISYEIIDDIESEGCKTEKIEFKLRYPSPVTVESEIPGEQTKSVPGGKYFLSGSMVRYIPFDKSISSRIEIFDNHDKKICLYSNNDEKIIDSIIEKIESQEIDRIIDGNE